MKTPNEWMFWQKNREKGQRVFISAVREFQYLVFRKLRINCGNYSSLIRLFNNSMGMLGENGDWGDNREREGQRITERVERVMFLRQQFPAPTHITVPKDVLKTRMKWFSEPSFHHAMEHNICSNAKSDCWKSWESEEQSSIILPETNPLLDWKAMTVDLKSSIFHVLSSNYSNR